MKLRLALALGLLLAGSCLANSQLPMGNTVVYSGGGAASPILFQHIATSTNPNGSGETGRAFVIHTESLPANTVAVLAVTAPNSITPTVSDTLAGSWSAGQCNAPGGTGNVKATIFVEALGATGGVDTITVAVGSTNVQPVQFDVSFFENINTTTPVNSSKCSTTPITPTSGGVITSASFTPSNNNANGGTVIWHYTALGNAGVSATTTTGWTAGSSFTLLNGGSVWWPAGGFPQASQYFVQTTAAAIAPAITAVGENATNGDAFNSAAVALNVANNSATAPSTIHVLNITHESTYQGTCASCTTTGPFPTQGNLRVLATTWPAGCPSGGGACLTSVTSSDGCTWHLVGNIGAGDSEQGYAQNCSPCPTCTISLTYTGSSNLGGSFRLYDIEGANSSSYQNESSGNSSCGTTFASAPSITPAVSAGLTIASNGIGTGPGTGVTSPTGAVFDLWTFTGQTDTDNADNADSQGHYYFSTNAAQNWTWTLHAASSCYWVAAVYK
jgi:hypothetical protein